MSGATFRILKQCLHCGNMFEAQKVTTRYCSHKCNSAHYKLKVKLEKKGEAEKVLYDQTKIRPKVQATSLALIKEKEFLTVKEVSKLFNSSRQSIYNLIKSGRLKATNLSIKKTLIKRSDIDKLFE